MSSPYGRSPDRQSVANTFKRVGRLLNRQQLLILRELRQKPKDTTALIDFLGTQERGDGNGNYKPSKTSVHQELWDARDRLEEFYGTPEGLSQRLKLELVHKDGQYRLSVTPNIPPQNATAFWAAYLGNGLPTRLVTGAKTTSHTTTVAHLRERDGSAIMTWQEDEPRNEIEAERKTNTFISISNVRSMFHLYEYFNTWHRKSELQPAPEIFAEEEKFWGREANYIFLGTPFDCESIMDLELAAEKGHHSCLFFNGDHTKYRTVTKNGEYRVWVLRRWLLPNFHTYIQAAHSSALEAVCNVLVSEDRFGKLIKKLWAGRAKLLGGPEWKGFPPEFRLEVRVKLAADGTGPEYIRFGEYTEMEGWGCLLEPTRYYRSGRKTECWQWPW